MGGLKQLAKLIIVLIVFVGLYACIGPVPVEVELVDNELYFVLDDTYEIRFLRVSAFVDKNKTGRGRFEPGNMKVMWLLGYDLTTEVKQRNYLKMKRIRYGQKLEAFSRTEGPVPLQKDVEYALKIDMGDKFAMATFVITEDNKIIRPDAAADRR